MTGRRPPVLRGEVVVAGLAERGLLGRFGVQRERHERRADQCPDPTHTPEGI